MSSELAGIDWLGRGWLLILAFTAAVLVVAALRRPCRRLFGTERAFQLWLLPSLALLASQLPHAAVASVVVWSPVVSAITSIASAAPAHAAGAVSSSWRVWTMLLWLSGSLVTLSLAAIAQSRYLMRLRGATHVTDVRSRWPMLRAPGTDIGPATIGAWRSRIVLPADFERRYDTIEQMLILAHEAIHARRRDGWWCLLAQLVAALFWFHPLAWWALAALRHDQELACDAAVLREHGEHRRSYANAMLKTQSAAFALPVGCPWSPRHPITERIAMLKLQQPDLLSQRASGVLLAFFFMVVTGAVYAATPSQSRADGILNDHNTLKIDVAMGGRPDSMHFSRCLKPGESTQLSGTDTSKLSWKGRFNVSPVAGGQLEVSAQVDTRFDRGNGNVRTQSAKPIVRTMPGRQATIVFGETIEDGHIWNRTREDNTIKIGVTPTRGCDSALLTSAGPHLFISRRGTASSTRELAESVSKEAGLILVNPESLSGRPMTLNVDQWPAISVLQVIADVDGLRAVVDDKRVRFEPK